jgi:hypothetical protein
VRFVTRQQQTQRNRQACTGHLSFLQLQSKRRVVDLSLC